jgi:HEAT repeat protein
MRKYIYISVVALAFTLLIFTLSWSNLKKNGVVRNILGHSIQPKPAAIPIPPPFEALGQGARLPTAQELKQEKKFNTQQVELASQWLKSPDMHQRIIGAEQLSAYKSPLSEQRLVDTLRHDAAPEVRKTAAQSLSSFKNLSDHTLSALFEGLSDKNESARIATLNALFSYALLINNDTKKSGQLLSKMRERLRSGRLNKDVRDSLEAFLKDQEPSANAFFSPLPSQTIQISK